MQTCTQIVASKERVRLRGQPASVDVVRVSDQRFRVTGGLVRTAELMDPWGEDVEDPAAVSRALKTGPLRVDLLKFWQRIPDTTPRYPYFHEWRYVAAIPITTHRQWLGSQITQNARNKIRKAARHGVEVWEEELNDRLIRAIMEIYNESPLRRGRPFWHYGKDFETVKAELSEDAEKSVFVTAYHAGELIGFIKFFVLDRYARTILVLDKMSRRDKAPMNSLISKVVEICERKGISHLVYSLWRRGNHGQFQRSSGFIKTPVPEYWVPLTMRGRLTVLLRVHQGVKGWIPAKMMLQLLSIRAKWYAIRFGTEPFRFSDKQ